MKTPLEEAAELLAQKCARRLDALLIWDMVCLYGDGYSFLELAVGEFPDGSKAIIRKPLNTGVEVDILGRGHRIVFENSHLNDYMSTRVI